MPSTARSVLVTGANSGIGLATALELAAAGYDVIGSVRSPTKADDVRRAAEQRAVAVRTVLLDVDDAGSCRRGVEQVAELTGGGPWALVNNAGFAQSGAVEDVSDEQVRAQLETNTVAPMRLARLVLPGMRARGDGRIVNVSSVAGFSPTGSSIAYAVSKAALNHLTRCLAVALGPEILVNCVAPGLMEGTRMTARLAPAQVQRALEGAVLKRAASRDDVADQVVTLARTDSTTGQTVVVDAGRYFH